MSEAENTTPPDHDVRVTARRRFLKAGLAAGPVIMTLQSKPVLGNVCHSPSGTMSGAMSQKAGQIKTCNGYPLSYWRNSGSAGGGGVGWVGIRPDLPYHPAFRLGIVSGSQQFLTAGLKSRPLTMYEVLCADAAQDPYGLCGHFITALLNINSGRIPAAVMDQTRLSQLWVEWSRTGRYRPSGQSKAWDAADIVQYFRSSGIAP